SQDYSQDYSPKIRPCVVHCELVKVQWHFLLEFQAESRSNNAIPVVLYFRKFTMNGAFPILSLEVT
ncbi:MAG: hypothetical protein ABF730_05645, partial [Bifidobacterium aquikefiri]|uniref:hypothetical protein n=1 Tax=Bifidobacterium aquikefiri TaxID=1653207 RepID=UPI0039EA2410